MPYSEKPPDIVFPRCDWGFDDAYQHYADGVRVEFCDRWKLDEDPIQNENYAHLKQVCRNREAMGDRDHNHCFRCVAGYPIWFDKKDVDHSEHRSLRV